MNTDSDSDSDSFFDSDSDSDQHPPQTKKFSLKQWLIWLTLDSVTILGNSGEVLGWCSGVKLS